MQIDEQAPLSDQLVSLMQQAYDEADHADEVDNFDARWAWNRAGDAFGRLAVQEKDRPTRPQPDS